MVSKEQISTSDLLRKFGVIPLAAGLVFLVLSAPRAYADILLTLSIDENCSGQLTYLSPSGYSGTVTLQCSLQPDPTQPSHPLVVTYQLPEWYQLPFGEVLVTEENPFSSVIGDVIRFTDGNGWLGLAPDPNGGSTTGGGYADLLIIYSLAPGTALAGTGLPSNINYSSSESHEYGAELFQFQWAVIDVHGVSSEVGPCDTNCTVTPVPEPSMLTLLGIITSLGLLGFIWLSRRLSAGISRL